MNAHDPVVRRVASSLQVTMPESWEEEIKKAPAAKEDGYVDYAGGWWLFLAGQDCCALSSGGGGRPWQAGWRSNRARAVRLPHAALVRTVEDMAPEEFAKIDLDKLVAQYSRR